MWTFPSHIVIWESTKPLSLSCKSWCSSLHQTITIITIITVVYLSYNISDFTEYFAIPLSRGVNCELAMKSFFISLVNKERFLAGHEKTLSFHRGRMLAWFTEKGYGAIIISDDESKARLETWLNLPLTQFLGSRKKGFRYFFLFTQRTVHLSINTNYIFIRQILNHTKIKYNKYGPPLFF